MKKKILIFLFTIGCFHNHLSAASTIDVAINDCNYSAGYNVSSYIASASLNPEIHIFGVYESRPDYTSGGGHPQGTANVYVERKGIPLVIVLSSYEPVLWKIHKEEGVNITQIILNGYYAHETEGAAGIQVINRSGIGNYIVSSSFEWSADKTQILVSEVENNLNKPITSYHGCYDASSFRISGDVILPTPGNLSFINLLLKQK